MTPIRGKIETTEDAIRWIYEHDGRIDALWDQQAALNHKNDRRLDAITTRLTACEKKVVFLAGIASLLGTLIGRFIPL